METENTQGIARSLETIRGLLRSAQNECLELDYEIHRHPDRAKEIIEYCVRTAYDSSLILLEQIKLPSTYEKLETVYREASESGFDQTKPDLDDDPFLLWRSPLESILDAISDFHLKDDTRTSISMDLVSIIKNSIYSITDTKIFISAPKNENDVHQRIEGVLKCVFPDLKHKPNLTKPIKNFQPDTGIPSLQTLIEYKFISNKSDAKRIVDEVLADTRGYISPEWSNFLFVIYETHRIERESKWNELINSCGVSKDTRAIVLHGESVKTSRKKKKKRTTKKSSGRKKIANK